MLAPVVLVVSNLARTTFTCFHKPWSITHVTTADYMSPEETASDGQEIQDGSASSDIEQPQTQVKK